MSEIGDIVICGYRLPSARQPWIHAVHVGVVEAAGTDPAEWNGRNSEADYCELTGKVRVHYGINGGHDFVQHDTDLTVVPAGFLELDHVAQVRIVLGDEAADLLTRTIPERRTA